MTDEELMSMHVGDKVYVLNLDIPRYIFAAELIDIPIKEARTKVYGVKTSYRVDENGNYIEEAIHEWNVWPSYIWLTIADASNCDAMTYARKEMEFRDEITDLASLITFPLSHDITNSNSIARNAYLDRANEIIGINCIRG